ncbi:MAG: hypothetical protein LIO65_09645 [Odoribacter sp.]|nr:hypothetical protein [Odoribacter sp.]
MKRLVFLTLLLFLCNFVFSQPLAFPGAEGFGKYTSGGRGGEIYIVTNLDDSGPGSLRDVISKPYRIIVFEVGGVIHIKSRLVFLLILRLQGRQHPVMV